MNEFNIGKNICEMRKAAGLTQEALADKLGISYQAVSKWENSLSCPDLALLPAIAEIFNTDINSLFGFSSPAASVHAVPGLPWEDDDTLYIALFQGHRLMEDYSAELKERLKSPLSFTGKQKILTAPWISAFTAAWRVMSASVETSPQTVSATPSQPGEMLPATP